MRQLIAERPVSPELRRWYPEAIARHLRTWGFRRDGDPHLAADWADHFDALGVTEAELTAAIRALEVVPPNQQPRSRSEHLPRLLAIVRAERAERAERERKLAEPRAPAPLPVPPNGEASAAAVLRRHLAARRGAKHGTERGTDQDQTEAKTKGGSRGQPAE